MAEYVKFWAAGALVLLALAVALVLVILALALALKIATEVGDIQRLGLRQWWRFHRTYGKT